MKKSLSILVLGLWPALALASGDQAIHDDHNRGQLSAGVGSIGKDHGAIGQPGDPAKANRTIMVTMDDTMRFTPSQIRVREGETIRFFVKNVGKLPHEMVIGSLAELKEHAAMMRTQPTMQHDSPNMTRVGPGQRGGIVWRFDQPGAVNFACLVTGHMEAGMMGTIVVQSDEKKSP